MAWRLLANDEILRTSCLGEPVVTADELEGGRIFRSRRERCRQLQSVGRPQTVQPQESDCSPADPLERLDLQPTGAQAIKLAMGDLESGAVEVLLPAKPIQRGFALDPTAPPGDDDGVLQDQVAPPIAGRLLDQKSHNGGGVPVLQRSSALSAAIRRLALIPAGRRGSFASSTPPTSSGARGAVARP